MLGRWTIKKKRVGSSEAAGGALNKVDARYRSSDGRVDRHLRWVRTVGLLQFGPAELPVLSLALLTRKWKGKIGWAPTNSSFKLS